MAFNLFNFLQKFLRLYFTSDGSNSQTVLEFYAEQLSPLWFLSSKWFMDLKY